MSKIETLWTIIFFKKILNIITYFGLNFKIINYVKPNLPLCEWNKNKVSKLGRHDKARKRGWGTETREGCGGNEVRAIQRQSVGDDLMRLFWTFWWDWEYDNLRWLSWMGWHWKLIWWWWSMTVLAEIVWA